MFMVLNNHGMFAYFEGHMYHLQLCSFMFVWTHSTQIFAQYKVVKIKICMRCTYDIHCRALLRELIDHCKNGANALSHVG